MFVTLTFWGIFIKIIICSCINFCFLHSLDDWTYDTPKNQECHLIQHWITVPHSLSEYHQRQQVFLRLPHLWARTLPLLATTFKTTSVSMLLWMYWIREIRYWLLISGSISTPQLLRLFKHYILGMVFQHPDSHQGSE